MYKPSLAVINLQWLICLKIQTKRNKSKKEKKKKRNCKTIFFFYVFNSLLKRKS